MRNILIQRRMTVNRYLRTKSSKLLDMSEFHHYCMDKGWPEGK